MMPRRKRYPVGSVVLFVGPTDETAPELDVEKAPIGLVVDHEDGGACGDTPANPFHIVSLGRGRARVALWHEEIRRLA